MQCLSPEQCNYTFVKPNTTTAVSFVGQTNHSLHFLHLWTINLRPELDHDTQILLCLVNTKQKLFSKTKWLIKWVIWDVALQNFYNREITSLLFGVFSVLMLYHSLISVSRYVNLTPCFLICSSRCHFLFQIYMQVPKWRRKNVNKHFQSQSWYYSRSWKW